MKIILISLITCFFTFQLLPQEKKMLPIEIKCDSFLLQYKYDDYSRITEIYYKDRQTETRDSIDYTSVKDQYIVRSFDILKGTSKKKAYVFGKKNSQGQTLHYDSGFSGYRIEEYQYDASDRIVHKKEGQPGGEGSTIIYDFYYQYTSGNLRQIYLDEYDRQEWYQMQRLPFLERLIYDESIDYDDGRGIFSVVNKQSQWLLMKSIGVFLPIMHVKNNPLRIRKLPDTKEVLYSRRYPAVDVDYTYQFNSKKYPTELKINSISDREEWIFGNKYEISYREASQKPAPKQVDVVKKTPLNVKRLPIRIYNEKESIHYTYDDQDRFTSIKRIADGKIDQYDSIVYYPNRGGFKIFHVTDSNGKVIGLNDYHEEYELKYERIGDSIKFEQEGSRTELTFTPTGMLAKMVIKDEDYDPETSIDPPVIIGYIYDEYDNLIDMDLPNNASGDRVNRNLQMIQYQKLFYDNKNGIFKYVNRDCCFIILYNQDNFFNYYYFMGNNLKYVKSEFEAGEDYEFSFDYKYNADDYPSKINDYNIEYK